MYGDSEEPSLVMNNSESKKITDNHTHDYGESGVVLS